MLNETADVDKLIARINAEELWRRRIVRDQDLNDWHGQLREWEARGQIDEAIDLLGEIMDVVVDLDWLDAREPQLYWFEQAAGLLRLQGRRQEAAAVMRRWLDSWPLDRAESTEGRDAVERRRAKVLRHLATLEAGAGP